MQASQWFEYSVRVQPQHTDYAAVVWHGTYISWMEAARIDALRRVGIEFTDLVQLGCDLPVIELSLRYHQPLRMGDIAVVKSCLSQVKRVKLYWEQHIYTAHHPKPLVTAQVTLVPVHRPEGRIIRQLPAQMQQAVAALLSPSNSTMAEPKDERSSTNI
ncbi:Acyl-CoA thioester hydrolase YbgC [Acaryochloris thomasi RCC1774]|uniref:Acyl-CoA thioester hydrolase YbgC n=1 Tax=Acaryochloris thomasi RCC1774 TaxID=1764569 RepID=A0A2W1JNC8_9CYAN|nr:thioesterase family protein [Acaryochloris thomasi]PZD74833.1 Acyl-CoA thioester hydrolase YbgC [Acaryochloris thomasi RCC1774]